MTNVPESKLAKSVGYLSIATRWYAQAFAQLVFVDSFSVARLLMPAACSQCNTRAETSVSTPTSTRLHQNSLASGEERNQLWVGIKKKTWIGWSREAERNVQVKEVSTSLQHKHSETL
ncbi:Gelation factor [Clarias magur]|uniref:Gelation factor n=1 Tax=Clarias magur TaxID=1594786 RepID=A0A8J4U9A0_CLAMG|nr:Gelation factor [Clarias magur]